MKQLIRQSSCSMKHLWIKKLLSNSDWSEGCGSGCWTMFCKLFFPEDVRKRNLSTSNFHLIWEPIFVVLKLLCFQQIHCCNSAAVLTKYLKLIEKSCILTLSKGEENSINNKKNQERKGKPRKLKKNQENHDTPRQFVRNQERPRHTQKITNHINHNTYRNNPLSII